MENFYEKLCIERIEQLLMTYNYQYDSINKLFKKQFIVNDNILEKIIYLDRSNKNYVLYIQEKYLNKEVIKYLGDIPNTELDFLILVVLLNLNVITIPNKQTIDYNHTYNVISDFKTKLINSNYEYNNITRKYFKSILTFRTPFYLSIYLDTIKDILIISEEYSSIDLQSDTNFKLNLEGNNLIRYNGSIPKTKLELSTIFDLFDLQIYS